MTGHKNLSTPFVQNTVDTVQKREGQSRVETKMLFIIIREIARNIAVAKIFKKSAKKFCASYPNIFVYEKFRTLIEN
jgi:hypothetical protein